MIDLKLVFDLLAAGGHTAIFGIVFLLWRLDRRVYRVELHLFDD